MSCFMGYIRADVEVFMMALAKKSYSHDAKIQSQRQNAFKMEIVGEVLTIPSIPEKVVNARRFVAEVARKYGFSDDDIFGIKLAVSEALSNAVIHGSSCGNDSFVQVVLLCSKEKMRIIIIDDGSFGPVNAGSNNEAEDGRGLGLISYFMDYVFIHPSVAGTSVTMVKNLYHSKRNCA